MLLRVIVLVALCCALPTWAADEAAQVRFLRELFARPEGDWRDLMQSHRKLLDDSFFERAEARMRWGLAHEHVEDALRFALVCDLAAQLVGRPGAYRLSVREWFLRVSPPLFDMVNSQGDAIQPLSVMISEPLAFLNGAYDLVQRGELEPAYRIFWELRNGGYRPEQCMFEMAKIDRTRGEVECAWDEFDRLQQSGYASGRCLYQKAMIDWDAGRKERAVLEVRQSVQADPTLQEARQFMEWLDRR